MIPHKLHEDIIAIVTGVMLVSLGTVLLGQAKLMTGGLLGVALLLQYATGLHFAAGYILINIPFFVLGIFRMGLPFVVRTGATIGLLATFNWAAADMIRVDFIHPVYATLTGGLLAGIGMLILFRHRTSLGGTNILALYLHDKFGWRTGTVLFITDLVILAAAFFVLPAGNLALSVLSTAIISSVLLLNHRADRYLGAS